MECLALWQSAMMDRAVGSLLQTAVMQRVVGGSLQTAVMHQTVGGLMHRADGGLMHQAVWGLVQKAVIIDFLYYVYYRISVLCRTRLLGGSCMMSSYARVASCSCQHAG